MFFTPIQSNHLQVIVSTVYVVATPISCNYRKENERTSHANIKTKSIQPIPANHQGILLSKSPRVQNY